MAKFTKEDWKKAVEELDVINDKRAKLLKPTEREYQGAVNRVEEIEEEIGVPLGPCEFCSEPVLETEGYSQCQDGGYRCVKCSPTYQDLASNPEMFVNLGAGDYGVHTPETVKPIIDAHLDAGGKMTDKFEFIPAVDD